MHGWIQFRLHCNSIWLYWKYLRGRPSFQTSNKYGKKYPSNSWLLFVLEDLGSLLNYFHANVEYLPIISAQWLYKHSEHIRNLVEYRELMDWCIILWIQFKISRAGKVDQNDSWVGAPSLQVKTRSWGKRCTLRRWGGTGHDKGLHNRECFLPLSSY